MNITGIYTIRNSPQPHYWDIVFEWEDQISRTLKIPLINVGKEYDQIYQPSLTKKLLNRLNAYQLFDKFCYTPNHIILAFHIGPAGVYSFYTKSNVIPIIIDFWKHENLKRFETVFRLCPKVFVTSRQVYDHLINKNIELNIDHLALSLPDKYYAIKNGVSKDIDIIQIGRRNRNFDEYVSQFLNEFPKIHYVHAEKVGNKIEMVSNQFGTLGSYKKREDFIGLLKRSKISLVSAPGLDEDANRTGGFSPVTPRFLESAACGCKLIGIYPDNADFNYYGVKDVAESVESYGEFKSVARVHLESSEIPEYRGFLQKHLTSQRAKELMKKLKALND